jgi:hypothetical protein
MGLIFIETRSPTIALSPYKISSKSINRLKLLGGTDTDWLFHKPCFVLQSREIYRSLSTETYRYASIGISITVDRDISI